MSTRLIMALLVPALLILGACGGDSVEDKQEEMGDLMEEATEILKGVTDRASAEAAKGKLADIAEKMRTLGKELSEKMKDMSLEEKAEAATSQATEMSEKGAAWMQEMVRVMQSEYGSVITEELKRIQSK